MDSDDAAIREIEQLPRTVESVGRLMQALRHGPPNVRGAALLALGEMPDPAAVEALVQAIKENGATFAAALQALRQIEARMREAIDRMCTELGAAGNAEPVGQRPGARSPAEAAAIAEEIFQSFVRSGRTFSDSTELIREDRDR